MPFVAGNKTSREAGIKQFEKDGGAASGHGEIWTASPSNKTRHVKNTRPKNFSLAESPKALIGLNVLGRLEN